MPTPRPHKPTYGTLALAGILAFLLCATPGAAQQTPDGPQIDPLSITGRTFAGLRLPSAIVDGPIEFAAARAWTWEEPEAGRPPVTRLVLAGGVRARLGGYSFTAARAAVWLARLDPPAPPDPADPADPADPEGRGAGPDVWQVFVYFDRVGSPGDEPDAFVAGERLPVHGVLRSPGGISLRADRLMEGRPDDAFRLEGERALATFLRRLAGVAPLDAPARRPPSDAPQRIAEFEALLPPAPRDEPIFASGGVIALLFSPRTGAVEYLSREDENILVATGGVTIQYWHRRQDRTLQLSAQRAVVFLAPGRLTQDLHFDSESVRGIYLEGDVIADDGQYSIRAPRVFYSIADNRAVMLEAVFWTFDQRRALPLYVRAASIRQESQNQFTARSARLTNTAFFDPDLAIGASSITVTGRAREEHDGRIHVDARDITIRALDVPIFYWPRFRGDPEAFPLRDLRIESTAGSGAALKTTWNALSLLGIDPPGGLSVDLLIDYYFQRGAALGAATRWDGDRSGGNLFAYAVLNDTGSDHLVTGRRIERDGEFRGIVLGEHRAALGRGWSLFAEAAHISDPTLIDAFFEPLGKGRREFTNALWLRRLSDHTAFYAGARASFHNFIANEYLVQAPGYTVDKFPELSYFRLADDLLGDVAPGLLTYSSEYRLGYMRLNMAEPTAAELGFTTPRLAREAFGIMPGESIADVLREGGLHEDPVGRFDTRHELSLQLAAGPLYVTPFAVGRFSAYDDDFEEFSPEAEPTRLWGAVGAQVGTQVQRVDNTVESRLFDLHRMRHIVEPSVTLWHAGTTVDRVDLPVYDHAVEDLAEGSAIRLALDQTWQTQRGGPGRWRSVDVLTLRGDVALASGDVDRRSPLGRFIAFRPEHSTLRDFATIDAGWQVTEVVGLGALTVYDMEDNQPAFTSIGAVIQQTPEFMAFGELRYLNALDATYLIVGARYDLTRKYTVSGSTAYDTDLGQFQTVSVDLLRRFPNVNLGAGATYNNISSDTSFGFVIQPLLGQNQAGARIRGLSPARSSVGTP